MPTRSLVVNIYRRFDVKTTCALCRTKDVYHFSCPRCRAVICRICGLGGNHEGHQATFCSQKCLAIIEGEEQLQSGGPESDEHLRHRIFEEQVRVGSNWGSQISAVLESAGRDLDDIAAFYELRKR